MKTRLARSSELPEIFANVHSEWPHHKDLSEHIKRRLASPQHLHANWFILKEQGHIAASLGAYPYHFLINQQIHPGIAIGAVHTHSAYRGRGLASQLIRDVHQYYKSENMAISLLFSDIGTEFYQKLGYQTVPILHGSAKAQAVQTWSCYEIPVENVWQRLIASHESYERSIYLSQSYKDWVISRFQPKAFKLIQTNQEQTLHCFVADYENHHYILAADFYNHRLQCDFHEGFAAIAYELSIDRIDYWHPGLDQGRPAPSEWKTPHNSIPMIHGIHDKACDQQGWLIQPLHHV